MKQKQHYAPQFYLRHFANEDEKIHVLDLKSGKVFTTGVKDVGFKKALYGLEDIKEVVSSIEYKRIVSKLEKGGNLTGEENNTLNFLLNNFIQRRPEFEDVVKNRNKTLLDLTQLHLLQRRDAKENGTDKINIDGKTYDISDQSVGDIDKMLKIIEQSRQRLDEETTSKKVFRKSIQNQNNLLEWVKKGNYFVARSGASFVTSNFFGGHDGFPISSNACLFNKELYNDELLGELFKGAEESLGNCQDEELINAVNRWIAVSPPHGNAKDKNRRFEIYAKEERFLQTIRSNQSVMNLFRVP